jgi:dynein heavy chain 2
MFIGANIISPEFVCQLVALTVRFENPELEQRKKQLLEQEEQLKLQLAQLEEKLLQTLGNSTGNILENSVQT